MTFPVDFAENSNRAALSLSSKCSLHSLCPSSNARGTTPCDQVSSSAHVTKWSISPLDATVHRVSMLVFGSRSAKPGVFESQLLERWQNKVGPGLLPNSMVTETVPVGWFRTV